MRTLLAFVLIFLMSGCANTVYRIEGESRTPVGQAKNACEKEDWLVIAPTRADVAQKGQRTSHPKDGLGIYKIGEDDPEAITDYVETMDLDPIIERKRSELAPYESKKSIATILGGAGVIAMTIGSVLFVSAFQTNEVRQPDGTTEEEQSISGSRAGIGGATVGVGFGLGIAGLAVNPGHDERTRANASRYAFLSPPDDPKKVEALVARHNSTIRRQCEARGGY